MTGELVEILTNFVFEKSLMVIPVRKQPARNNETLDGLMIQGFILNRFVDSGDGLALQ